MFIEISDAVESYGSGETKVFALDRVQLSLDEGKFYVILGPSGSGKSTLLNMLGGLDQLESGSISVDGTDLTALSKKQLCDYRRDSVGFVFQFYNLIPDLTIRENIQAVSDISKDPLDIDEMLTSLGIDKYRDRFPKELSGGQQQRAAIARALVKNPKILLCDEPTGALDTKSSRMVLEFLEKIHDRYGTTVMIVTHNEGISEMSDTIIRLRDGRIESKVENKNKKRAKDITL
ncbi:MAG TPA: ABC transporter ATP-binding protein [Ruminococcus sp.]|nr:ABC transporter ATP-binding protein [Ruminococcus sp.]